MTDKTDKEKRDAAYLVIEPYIQRLNQYSIIYLDDAQFLLGEEFYEKLMGDPIKSRGPNKTSVYYWNVLDYYVMKCST